MDVLATTQISAADPRTGQSVKTKLFSALHVVDPAMRATNPGHRPTGDFVSVGLADIGLTTTWSAPKTTATFG